MATDETIGDLVTKEMRKGTGNREIHLKADKKVDYGTVVHLMDVVKLAGIDRLGMITAPSPKNPE